MKYKLPKKKEHWLNKAILPDKPTPPHVAVKSGKRKCDIHHERIYSFLHDMGMWGVLFTKWMSHHVGLSSLHILLHSLVEGLVWGHTFNFSLEQEKGHRTKKREIDALVQPSALPTNTEEGRRFKKIQLPLGGYSVANLPKEADKAQLKAAAHFVTGTVDHVSY